MNLIDNIKKTENSFPMLFSTYIKKEYGILFYDLDNKNSFDSNHVILFNNKCKLSDALREINNFYLTKDIVPRIYQSFTDGFFEKNKKIFESEGYEIKYFGKNKYMVLSEKNQIIKNGRLNVRQINHLDEKIEEDIFNSSGEEYEINVFKKSLKQKNVFVFAGYVQDKAVTITKFHISENNCTRFDYILTANDERKNGYARELLSYVVDFCTENKIYNCYQWPAHATSERLCYEAGFRTLFETESAEAIYKK